MKKLFAAFVIIFVCFGVSACSLGTSLPDEYLKHGTDINDKYVTALNINLISLFESVDEDNPDKYYSQYFIEIGARYKALSEKDAKEIMNELYLRYGINASYLQTYFLEDRQQEYAYYVFSFKEVQNLRVEDTKYGFFTIRQDYRLNSRYWVDNLRRTVLDTAQDIFKKNNSNYVIDEDFSRLRYFFVQETELKASGAQKVYKDLVSQNDMASLMWETTDDEYDFSSLELNISALAAGWYVVAIIAGVAVVLIILLATRKKIDQPETHANPCGSDGQGEESSDAHIGTVGAQVSIEELSGDPVLHVAEQLLPEDGDSQASDGAAEAEILDNQISMDDFIGNTSEEENG